MGSWDDILTEQLAHDILIEQQQDEGWPLDKIRAAFETMNPSETSRPESSLPGLGAKNSTEVRHAYRRGLRLLLP